jgi:hypothetical protein
MNFWSFGAIFVDFSVARDLFVNIFLNFRLNRKITDCGLILEKKRGFFAKSAKLDRRLILQRNPSIFPK